MRTRYNHAARCPNQHKNDWGPPCCGLDNSVQFENIPVYGHTKYLTQVPKAKKKMSRLSSKAHYRHLSKKVQVQNRLGSGRILSGRHNI